MDVYQDPSRKSLRVSAFQYTSPKLTKHPSPMGDWAVNSIVGVHSPTASANRRTSDHDFPSKE